MKRKPQRPNSPVTTKQPVLMNTPQGLVMVQPTQSFCMLKKYTDAELAVLIKSDPSFMAVDAKNYKDKMYVRSMCEIYTLVAENSTEPLTQLKHFKIEELEKAIAKLAKEQPKLYRHLCRVYGIDPKNKRSCKRAPNDNDFTDILQLSSWGYVELFFHNILASIEKVAKKMYSSVEMSNLEKAKYAHAFFLFIYTFSTMPYDLNKYYEQLAISMENSEAIKLPDNVALLEQAIAAALPQENNTIYEAIMLQNAYDVLFKVLPDNCINIDAIKFLLNDILDTADSLRIKEFVGLLTPDEASQFAALSLTPISYNRQVRELKEKIFPNGGWFTTYKLFFKLANTDKFNASVKAAWNKFEKNGCKFGVGVEGLKKPPILSHALSKKSYEYTGYLYAKSPRRIRISDPNELWMMRFYLKNL